MVAAKTHRLAVQQLLHCCPDLVAVPELIFRQRVADNSKSPHKGLQRLNVHGPTMPTPP
jgi:hypothetical protein